MISYFDHTYSFVTNNDLDAEMARWERCGFLLLPDRTQHPNGMEAAFVHLTGCFLEFLAVRDEAAFDQQANEQEHATCRNPRVIGVGAVCRDPFKLETRLREKFSGMKPAYSREAADKPGEPRWSYCPMPIEANPGVHVFAFRNHKRHRRPVEMSMGGNTVFGITGLVFCTRHANERRAAWVQTYRDLLPDFTATPRGFATKLQTVEWITPEEYARDFGEPWCDLGGLHYDVAAVRLGCADLQRAAKMFEEGGLSCRRLQPKSMFVTMRDRNTGYSFVVERGDPTTYLAALNADQDWGSGPEGAQKEPFTHLIHDINSECALG